MITALGLTAPGGPADEVDLTSGQTLRGIIDEETPGRIRLTVAGLSRLTVPRDRIVAIRRDDPADNALLMGELHLEQGMLWEAGQHFQTALNRGVEPGRIAALLLARPATLVERLGQEPPDRIASLSALFLQVLAAAPREGDVLFLAGRLCEVTGDGDRASDAYAHIDTAWWEAHPDAAHGAAQFYLRHAREALEEGRLDDVVAMLEQITAVDMSLATELRPVFLIRLANLLVEQGAHGEAIQIVGDDVAPLAPQVAHVWLQSVFQELEHRPLAGESLERVVPVFARHYRQHFPADADARLAQLQRSLGDQLLAEGQYQRARAAYNEYYALAEPDAPARPLVLAATYAERAAALPPGDWDGRVRLVVEMIESELWPQALDQIEILTASDDPEIRSFALQQRNAIGGRLALDVYQRAFTLYTEGEVQRALDLLTAEAGLFENARLLEEMSELRALCENRMRESQTQRAHRALARYQEAEHRYLQGRYEEAIPVYQEVMREYAGTHAATQAAERLAVARRFVAVRHPGEGGIDLDAAAAASAETAAPPPRIDYDEEARRRELESLLDAVTQAQETREP